MDRITKIFAKKKVTLSDIAAPRPSRAADRVLKNALTRAHKDQERVSRKAQELRAR
jgi:hypothetical protein